MNFSSVISAHCVSINQPWRQWSMKMLPADWCAVSTGKEYLKKTNKTYPNKTHKPLSLWPRCLSLCIFMFVKLSGLMCVDCKSISPECMAAAIGQPKARKDEKRWLQLPCKGPGNAINSCGPSQIATIVWVFLTTKKKCDSGPGYLWKLV